MKFYAGIGSRETPQDVLDLMLDLGSRLAEEGWTLRSGAADGADAAFEAGARQVGGPAEIYLPWPGFNGSDSRLDSPADWTFDLAQRYHPAWERLSQGGRKLMARNAHQVLGHAKPPKPSRFVVCWTPEARGGGGTGQACRMAAHYGIPVFDLAEAETRIRLQAFAWAGQEATHA